MEESFYSKGPSCYSSLHLDLSVQPVGLRKDYDVDDRAGRLYLPDLSILATYPPRMGDLEGLVFVLLCWRWFPGAL